MVTNHGKKSQQNILYKDEHFTSTIFIFIALFYTVGPCMYYIIVGVGTGVNAIKMTEYFAGLTNIY